MHIWFFQYIQLSSLILGIYCLKGLNQFKLTAFIPLLIVVVITEAFASNFRLFGWENNYGIYSIYLVVSTPIAFYIYFQMLLYRGYAKYIYIGTVCLLTFYIAYNASYGQGIHTFNTYSMIMVEFVSAVVCLLIILKLFLADDTTTMLNKHPYFWISGATLLFSAGALVITGLQQYILKHKIDYHGVRIYYFLMPALNYLLYGSYCYSFVLCRRLISKPLLP